MLAGYGQAYQIGARVPKPACGAGVNVFPEEDSRGSKSHGGHEQSHTGGHEWSLHDRARYVRG